MVDCFSSVGEDKYVSMKSGLEDRNNMIIMTTPAMLGIKSQ